MSIAQTITLSNGQLVEVPEGADPESFRKFREAKLKLATSPKKRKARRRSSRRKRTFRASSVLSGAEIQTRDRAEATAELVTRANQTESTDLDGVSDDPQGGYVVKVNGEEVAWIDDEPTAWQAYHAEVDDPRSIPWYINGELSKLEVW